MNYLGHIVCSHGRAEVMMDNFLTDMLTHKEMLLLKEQKSLGLQLHWWLDEATDHHPAIKSLHALFRPAHHKYSPVVVDLILDFLIAHNWYRFRKVKYEDYCEEVFAIMMQQRFRYSELIRKRIENMVASEWLLKQRSIEGLRFTLKAMDKRTSFPSQFELAEHQLMHHFQQTNELFWNFWQEIYRASEAYLLSLEVERNRDHS